jgi:hypothetical protein
MRRTCAWCGTDLGAAIASRDPEAERTASNSPTGDTYAGEPSDAPGVASTICRSCADGLATYRKPVLVVSPEWARMYDQLVELLKAQPEIQVILDRRQPPSAEGEALAWDGPDRRRGGHPLVIK